MLDKDYFYLETYRCLYFQVKIVTSASHQAAQSGIVGGTSDSGPVVVARLYIVN